MQFTKMHGLGNDFVMVTHEDLPVAGIWAHWPGRSATAILG